MKLKQNFFIELDTKDGAFAFFSSDMLLSLVQ